MTPEATSSGTSRTCSFDLGYNKLHSFYRSTDSWQMFHDSMAFILRLLTALGSIVLYVIVFILSRKYYLRISKTQYVVFITIYLFIFCELAVFQIPMIRAQFCKRVNINVTDLTQR